MKITDIELYRWKWHNEVYIHAVKKHHTSFIGSDIYWREYGAFCSVLPRQSGKTSMLIQISRIFDEKKEIWLILTPNQGMADAIKQKYLLPKEKVFSASGPGFLNLIRSVVTPFSDIHLLVDEFLFIKELGKLHLALNNPWKSVTMVSSL
jgi:hypothetical protein